MFRNIPKTLGHARLGCRAGLSALAMAIAFASPSAALDNKDSGSARINLAAKLRNVTQEVMANACEVAVAHGGAAAVEHLDISRQNLVSILDALEYGDTALGLESAEPSRKVLKAVRNFRDAWAPVAVHVDRILASNDPLTAYDAAAALNEEMLTRSEGLLAVISGTYSNSETFPIAATLAVNIAVRQQMLMRQIERRHCEITGHAPGFEGAQAELEHLTGLFDVSMTALRNGEPSVGLMAPPTDAVASSLAVSADHWAAMRPAYLQAASTGTSPTSETQQVAAAENMIKSLQNVQVLYILGSSNQPDIYRVPLKRYAEEQLSRWLLEPTLILALRDQNVAHVDLVQSDIDALDLTWRAEAEAGTGPLIEDLLSRPVSDFLKAAQLGTAGMVTEVFVMDNHGLNVGQSQVTSDYWQGDEAKWQETFLSDGDAMHLSDVEYDESTGFYQVQVSMPIADPMDGKHVGAITFGVNIQSLF